MEHLMKPRFEVLADFPGNEGTYKVGEILDRDWTKYTNDDETKDPIWRISDFPHLFRKLNWWELRTVNEMPNYLRSLQTNDVWKIERWNEDLTFGYIEGNSGCDLNGWKPEYGYVPATEEEYNSKQLN